MTTVITEEEEIKQSFEEEREAIKQYYSDRNSRIFYTTIIYGTVTGALFSGAIVWKTNSIIKKESKKKGNKHLRKILANEVRRLTIGGVIITIGYGVLSYYVASQFDSVRHFGQTIKPYLFKDEIHAISIYIRESARPYIGDLSEVMSEKVDTVCNAIHLPPIAPPKSERNVYVAEGENVNLDNFVFVDRNTYPTRKEKKKEKELNSKDLAKE